MRALRLILFGVLLALFALFAFSNWARVNVVLPDGSVAAIFLPVVVFIAFLAGWLPMLLLHFASKAGWRRRHAKTDRLLEEALSTGPRVAAAAPPVVVPVGGPIAPQGQPTVVPPAGA